MEIARLIQHPELLDRGTLYELRSLLALYPYYQTARLLMLRNLYLLHDPAFDEELRRASLYVTDRRTIFQMIEAAHYQLRSGLETAQADGGGQRAAANRTVALIDSFLDSIPADDQPATPKRPPTPADATVDYVAYLLESGGLESEAETPQLKGQELIDNFLEQEQGRITLAHLPAADEGRGAAAPAAEGEEPIEEEYFTETLARIYIKQGRYQKALDIIQRLSQRVPNKSAYFADQIRFLEKLIINSKRGSNKIS